MPHGQSKAQRKKAYNEKATRVTELFESFLTFTASNQSWLDLSTYHPFSTEEQKRNALIDAVAKKFPVEEDATTTAERLKNGNIKTMQKVLSAEREALKKKLPKRKTNDDQAADAPQAEAPSLNSSTAFPNWFLKWVFLSLVASGAAALTTDPNTQPIAPAPNPEDGPENTLETAIPPNAVEAIQAHARLTEGIFDSTTLDHTLMALGTDIPMRQKHFQTALEQGAPLAYIIKCIGHQANRAALSLSFVLDRLTEAQYPPKDHPKHEQMIDTLLQTFSTLEGPFALVSNYYPWVQNHREKVVSFLCDHLEAPKIANDELSSQQIDILLSSAFVAGDEVSTTERNRLLAIAKKQNWSISTNSVLYQPFLARLEKADQADINQLKTIWDLATPSVRANFYERTIHRNVAPNVKRIIAHWCAESYKAGTTHKPVGRQSAAQILRDLAQTPGLPSAAITHFITETNVTNLEDNLVSDSFPKDAGTAKAIELITERAATLRVFSSNRALSRLGETRAILRGLTKRKGALSINKAQQPMFAFLMREAAYKNVPAEEITSFIQTLDPNWRFSPETCPRGFLFDPKFRSVAQEIFSRANLELRIELILDKNMRSQLASAFDMVLSDPKIRESMTHLNWDWFFRLFSENDLPPELTEKLAKALPEDFVVKTYPRRRTTLPPAFYALLGKHSAPDTPHFISFPETADDQLEAFLRTIRYDRNTPIALSETTALNLFETIVQREKIAPWVIQESVAMLPKISAQHYDFFKRFQNAQGTHLARTMSALMVREIKEGKPISAEAEPISPETDTLNLPYLSTLICATQHTEERLAEEGLEFPNKREWITKCATQWGEKLNKLPDPLSPDSAEYKAFRYLAKEGALGQLSWYDKSNLVWRNDLPQEAQDYFSTLWRNVIGGTVAVVAGAFGLYALDKRKTAQLKAEALADNFDLNGSVAFEGECPAEENVFIRKLQTRVTELLSTNTTKKARIEAVLSHTRWSDRLCNPKQVRAKIRQELQALKEEADETPATIPLGDIIKKRPIFSASLKPCSEVVKEEILVNRLALWIAKGFIWNQSEAKDPFARATINMLEVAGSLLAEPSVVSSATKADIGSWIVLPASEAKTIINDTFASKTVPNAPEEEASASKKIIYRIRNFLECYENTDETTRMLRSLQPQGEEIELSVDSVEALLELELEAIAYESCLFEGHTLPEPHEAKTVEERTLLRRRNVPAPPR